MASYCKPKTAIEGGDKSIDHLQKTKEALLGTDGNLRLANDTAQDVTIKRLTRVPPDDGDRVCRAQKTWSVRELNFGIEKPSRPAIRSLLPSGLRLLIGNSG